MSVTRHVIKAQVAPAVRKPIDTKDYVRWGVDDNRPQELLDMLARSSTGTVCAGTKAKFIEGNGFKDQAFYQAVINRRVQTMDELLTLVADRQSKLVGYGLLINLNLLGNPCEVYHIPTEHLRLGLPDEQDTVHHIFIKRPKVPGTKGRAPKPTRHLVYDPAEPAEDRADRMASWPGGPAAYPGEVFYYFAAAAGYYPVPVYESVEIDLDAEPRLKRSRRNDTASGYSAQVMITEYGTDTPTETKMKADAEKYGEFIGEDGARILQQYAKDKAQKPDVDTIQAPDASKRYATDGSSLKADIRAVFQIPDICYGESQAGKLGMDGEFEDAMKYVQRMVVNTDQRAIERGFGAVFSTFQRPDQPNEPLCPSNDYSIENLTLTTGEVDLAPQADKTLEALAGLDALVANKVLDKLSDTEIRRLVGLGPAVDATTPPSDGNAAA